MVRTCFKLLKVTEVYFARCSLIFKVYLQAEIGKSCVQNSIWIVWSKRKVNLNLFNLIKFESCQTTFDWQNKHKVCKTFFFANLINALSVFPTISLSIGTSFKFLSTFTYITYICWNFYSLLLFVSKKQTEQRNNSLTHIIWLLHNTLNIWTMAIHWSLKCLKL